MPSGLESARTAARCARRKRGAAYGYDATLRDSAQKKKDAKLAAIEVTKRLFAAATGLGNIYFGTGKIRAAGALGVASTVDGPAAAATGTGAAYLGINGTGQVMTGAANLTYAITGDTRAEEAGQVLTATTTVSGVVTLATTGNVPLAATYGNAENMVGGFMDIVKHDTAIGEIVNSSVEWLTNRISYAEGKQQQDNQPQQ